MKKILLFALFVVLSATSYTQSIDRGFHFTRSESLNTFKRWGSEHWFMVTDDASIFSYSSRQFSLFKLDKNGDVLWRRSFGSDRDHHYLFRALPLRDGRLVIQYTSRRCDAEFSENHTILIDATGKDVLRFADGVGRYMLFDVIQVSPNTLLGMGFLETAFIDLDTGKIIEKDPFFNTWGGQLKGLALNPLDAGQYLILADSVRVFQGKQLLRTFAYPAGQSDMFEHIGSFSDGKVFFRDFGYGGGAIQSGILVSPWAYLSKVELPNAIINVDIYEDRALAFGVDGLAYRFDPGGFGAYETTPLNFIEGSNVSRAFRSGDNIVVAGINTYNYLGPNPNNALGFLTFDTSGYELPIDTKPTADLVSVSIPKENIKARQINYSYLVYELEVKGGTVEVKNNGTDTLKSFYLTSPYYISRQQILYQQDSCASDSTVYVHVEGLALPPGGYQMIPIDPFFVPEFPAGGSLSFFADSPNGFYGSSSISTSVDFDPSVYDAHLIWPNPVRDILTISPLAFPKPSPHDFPTIDIDVCCAGLPLPCRQVEVFTISGTRVLSTTLDPDEYQNYNIDVSFLCQGMYFYKAGQATGKFVKQ